MAGHLIGAKPLTKPIISYYQLQSDDQISMEFQLKWFDNQIVLEIAFTNGY